MGLDSVEIVLGTEDYFRISLRDEETAKVRTVGDLVDLVRRTLGREVFAHCPTARSFYRLRAAARDLELSSTVRLRPGTPLAALLPAEGRRERWWRLGQKIDFLPRLVLRKRDRALVKGVAWLTVVLPVPVVWGLYGFGFAILALLLLSVTFSAWVETRKIEFPEQLDTLGCLARAVAPAVHDNGAVPPGGEILAGVQRVTASVLGISPEKATTEARFREDLGMD